MPSAGLEPATPSLGRRRSGPLSYEGMLPAARLPEVIIDIRRSGRSSARLECTVRDREVGGSNPLAPTPSRNSQERDAGHDGECAGDPEPGTAPLAQAPDAPGRDEHDGRLAQRGNDGQRRHAE